MKIRILFYSLLISQVVFGQIVKFECPKKPLTEYHNNTVLRKVNNSYVDTGSGVVFRMIKEYDCTEDYYDDQTVINLAWQIPAGVSEYSFKISKNDSLTLPLNCIIRAGWNIAEALVWGEGKIDCKLTGEIWEVDCSLNLFLKNYFTKSFFNRKLEFKEKFSIPKTKRHKKKSAVTWTL